MQLNFVASTLCAHTPACRPQVKVVRSMKAVSVDDVVLGQYRARTTQVSEMML